MFVSLDSAVNFARIGFDISQALLQAIFLFGEQYKEQQYSRSFGTDALKEKRFTTESTDCFERYDCFNLIPISPSIISLLIY